MRILETEDEVVKVYEDKEHVYLEFEARVYALTALEAHTLGHSLLRIAEKTSYYKDVKSS